MSTVFQSLSMLFAIFNIALLGDALIVRNDWEGEFHHLQEISLLTFRVAIRASNYET